eukprot:CAMPEP_0185582552 /NCGR_PEP_ID=MMETSP0434-20130131/20967_1 /TAXON_ID=626734 ORGANISM="Favella taraikaensis, Strain Fe Narragansett Bay" /NCGR_SAMPLE_ID=MMETSP0434 /ASSEMBLY_ACC=CAM_ASM_000379 /LENGTH=38 /DNA_ID= /DNA_START= /DNA_END= /DNA_ORIENTATION=
MPDMSSRRRNSQGEIVMDAVAVESGSTESVAEQEQAAV